MSSKFTIKLIFRLWFIGEPSEDLIEAVDNQIFDYMADESNYIAKDLVFNTVGTTAGYEGSRIIDRDRTDEGLILKVEYTINSAAQLGAYMRNVRMEYPRKTIHDVMLGAGIKEKDLLPVDEYNYRGHDLLIFLKSRIVYNLPLIEHTDQFREWLRINNDD